MEILEVSGFYFVAGYDVQVVNPKFKEIPCVFLTSKVHLSVKCEPTQLNTRHENNSLV